MPWEDNFEEEIGANPESWQGDPENPPSDIKITDADSSEGSRSLYVNGDNIQTDSAVGNVHDVPDKKYRIIEFDLKVLSEVVIIDLRKTNEVHNGGFIRYKLKNGDILYRGKSVGSFESNKWYTVRMELAWDGDAVGCELFFDNRSVHKVEPPKNPNIGQIAGLQFTQASWGSGEHYIDRVYMSKEASADINLNNTQESTPTATKTPTPTRTQSRTMQAAESTPISETQYSLSSAGLYRTVPIEGKIYRIVWDIPNAERNRRAVLTPEGKLAAPSITYDAFVTDAWATRNQVIDWGNVVQQAKKEKSSWNILEQLNRLADLSSEVAAALALSSLSPTASLRFALGALESAIVWGNNELSDPYREQFTKMKQASETLNWVDSHTDGISSASQMSTELIDVISFGLDTYSAATDLSDLAGTANTVRNTLQSTGSIKQGLVAGGTTAQAATFQMWAGIIASKADIMLSGFQFSKS